MKLPAWFPHPLAWLSALLLFFFSKALVLAMGILIPILVELARYSPRLAFLGVLLMWVSPVPLVALGHRILGGVLDAADFERGAKAGALRLTSWWAGVYAWGVLLLASTTTMFIMLVIDPPPPPDPDALALSALRYMNAAVSLGVSSLVWIVVAAALYQFERASRKA